MCMYIMYICIIYIASRCNLSVFSAVGTNKIILILILRGRVRCTYRTASTADGIATDGDRQDGSDRLDEVHEYDNDQATE